MIQKFKKNCMKTVLSCGIISRSAYMVLISKFFSSSNELIPKGKLLVIKT